MTDNRVVAAHLISGAMRRRNVMQKEVATALHRNPATFSRHLSENTLRAQEFIEAAGYLGYKVTLVDAETDEELAAPPADEWPRVKKQIDGVLYDTAQAMPVCRTPELDGWWMGLHQTSEGRFFVAHYTRWEGAENFITLCPESEARKLIENCR